MEIETKAVLVRIEGRVQGVGFRVWTLHEAQALGLVGWVRNEADGSVTARLEGPQESVERMLGMLRVDSRRYSLRRMFPHSVALRAPPLPHFVGARKGARRCDRHFLSPVDRGRGGQRS
jgi:acylphosphatase